MILQDTDSCLFSHKLSGFTQALPHQIHYRDTLETCLAYSKMIIIKVLSMREYGDPNTVGRLSKICPPPGIL